VIEFVSKLIAFPHLLPGLRQDLIWAPLGLRVRAFGLGNTLGPDRAIAVLDGVKGSI